MLKIETNSGVAIMTMDRPDQRNAMSAELVQALIAAFVKLDDDPGCKAIILTGAGNGFCAGSDLAGLARMAASEQKLFEAESGRLARLIACISKPVIAAVNGYAIGGGMTLAASCDLIVAQSAAKWSLPEVPIGLFPAWGIESVIERVGRPAAKRLSWGIDTLTGEEAQRLGLVDILVDGDSLTKARDIADKLAKLPVPQASFVKEYFLGTVRAGAEAADAVANALFIRAAGTDAARSSLKRFGPK
jgi:enoyl-CoA hydratase